MSADTGKNSGEFSRLFAERENRDKADTSTATDTNASNSSSNVDATCMYEEDTSQKRERDVAFAVAVLAEGGLSERQLAKAVKNWTIHGADTLADHLNKHNLLTAKQCDAIKPVADERLQRANEWVASRGANAHQSTSTSLLAQLDSGGRVTSLLGLGLTQTWEATDRDRTVTTRYQLLRQIGQGGMGTVWLARDEELGRLVAIKEIRRGGADTEGAVSRFRREAQVTGRLEHPSIVPVHQLGGEVADGSAFYVMRFLGKRTLEDAVVEYHERRESGDANPMHLHRLLTAFVTVCQAIAYAHSRNVVHRDLKPENIALDDFGQVIVLDWGLAKLTGRAEVQDVFGDIELGEMGRNDQTTAGQVLGTPMYMAPEQAAGRLDEIEPATDVYGLGAILFAILTGYAPHEKSHSSLTSTSKVTELFQAIVGGDAPSALLLNPDAPPELDAVCAKAMANRRYARYATALELAEEVQRWMAGEPVTTYAEPWRKRVWRWMGTHRRTSQLVGVVATILVVTAVTLSVTSRQNHVAEQRARYEGLKADVGELEVGLRGMARDLAKNARFMGALPPVQAIIDVREGDAADADDETEEVWQGRLQMIYRGLLEANPNYLSASYASIGDGPRRTPTPKATTIKESESSDGASSNTDSSATVAAPVRGAHEIVRVERQSAASSVQLLPQSRLANLETEGLVELVSRLKPGDVSVDDAPILHKGEAIEDRDELVLTAAVPIYSDTSGDFFGVVAIETDLDTTLRDVLKTSVEVGEDAYVVDSDGKVLLHYVKDKDFQRSSVGRNIGEIVDGAEAYFGVATTEDIFSIGRTAYGVKVTLDTRRETSTIGVVVTITP